MNKDITAESMDHLHVVSLDQDEKGMEKYGVPLDEEMDYDFLGMAYEELADLNKYLYCEKMNKETVKDMLHRALRSGSMDYVEQALMVLEKGD